MQSWGGSERLRFGRGKFKLKRVEIWIVSQARVNTGLKCSANIVIVTWGRDEIQKNWRMNRPVETLSFEKLKIAKMKRKWTEHCRNSKGFRKGLSLDWRNSKELKNEFSGESGWISFLLKNIWKVEERFLLRFIARINY